MKIRKYTAVVALASRQAVAARVVILGRAAFYAVLLVIFARIWKIVGDKGALGSFGRVDLVWYLALTELIALSIPPVHLEIEADIRSGNIVYLLTRPISYFWMCFAQGLGTLLVRMAVLCPFGFSVALALGRELPRGGFSALLAGALAAVGAATLSLLFYAIIGLSAFFIEDTSPVQWVWQKLSFVFGGLMFPLDVYPRAMQRVASFTPFPSLLYAPGRIAIGAERA
ncbi:MAG TPA: ABC-2 family transporter protein, partial [Polyangiaceae bacterium]|nr:ABC-2 family transporter protein [Polyangiaceae bacterium]